MNPYSTANVGLGMGLALGAASAAAAAIWFSAPPGSTSQSARAPRGGDAASATAIQPDGLEQSGADGGISAMVEELRGLRLMVLSKRALSMGVDRQ